MKAWMGWIRGVLVATILVMVVVRIFMDLNSDGPVNLYQDLQRAKLADMEAAATIKANADAKAAFDTAMSTCGPSPDITCRARIYGAAQDAALKALMDGGCMKWEMSEWDPSRGLKPRAVPKDQHGARVECEIQASHIADRVTQSIR